ncbi:2804_t:CDS:2, partial [Racocetra fulgida]
IFTYLQAIIDFRTGVRNNQLLLRNAARHQFAPIWSSRRHPIYRMLEISHKENLLYLKPHIREIVENFSVVSHSELQNQHQGLDAVVEEINKELKSLIPPVPSQRHWEIAARNYTNFMKFFSLKINSTLTNLDGDVNLSEEIKSFSILAQERRQMLIKKILLQQTNTNVWQLIPVTEQEADTLKNENTMKKEELIAIINSVLISLPDSQRTKYTNLKNKTKAVLLKILQEIRDLNSAEEIIDEEKTNNELTDEKLTNE